MKWIKRNRPLGPPVKATKFRRLALGSWNAPNDPTLYGMLEINMEAALSHIDQLKKTTSEKITVTHYLGRVFALVLRDHPELNCEARFGKFYPRTSVDLSFQIAIEDGALGQGARHDLSSCLVENADQKTILKIAEELNASANKIRREEDPLFKGIKRLSHFIPGFVLSPGVSVLKWFIGTLNLWSPLLGIPKNAFGGLMLTNVGSLGLDFAFPSLFPPASVASIIAIGAIYRAPVYETDSSGQVLSTRLERFVRLCGAFDHRYIDGMHAAHIARDIRKYAGSPELL